MNKVKFQIVPERRCKKEMSDIDKILNSTEKEILLLIAQGYLSIQIAKMLNLDKHTIDLYRDNLWKKLQVNCQLDLHQTAVDYYAWYTNINSPKNNLLSHQK